MSLRDYCEGAECPTRDEQVAETEDLMDDCYHELFLYAGPCGDLEYITVTYGVRAYTHSFDASGALVAVHFGEDVPSYCDNTSREKWFGPIPECEDGTPSRYFCEEGQP